MEDAGCHSGDATLLLPAQRLNMETHRRVMHIASQLCQALEISGPFNVQFLALEGSASSHRMVKVIECNVRASRTAPLGNRTGPSPDIARPGGVPCLAPRPGASMAVCSSLGGALANT